MKRIGTSEIAARAQARLAQQPSFDEVLATEKSGSLLLYELVVPHAQPQLGYYVEWVRIAPHDERHSIYTVSLKQGRKWQPISFEGTLEQCLDELRKLKVELKYFEGLFDTGKHMVRVGDSIVRLLVAEMLN